MKLNSKVKESSKKIKDREKCNYCEMDAVGR